MKVVGSHGMAGFDYYWEYYILNSPWNGESDCSPDWAGREGHWEFPDFTGPIPQKHTISGTLNIHLSMVVSVGWWTKYLPKKWLAFELQVPISMDDHKFSILSVTYFFGHVCRNLGILLASILSIFWLKNELGFKMDDQNYRFHPPKPGFINDSTCFGDLRAYFSMGSLPTNYCWWFRNPIPNHLRWC